MSVLAGLLVLSLTAVLTAYWPVFISIYERWAITEGYSHGYLVVIMSVYLIVRAWPQLRSVVLRPAPLAWLAIALASAVAFFGYAAQIQLLQQLMLPALLWLCVVAALGWRAGWVLAMPFALLYFTVPMWEFLTDPLRAWTVFVANHLLNAMNIPVHIDGFAIQMATGTIEVAGGCSGLNFLLTGLVIGSLHAYLSVRSPLRALLIISIAALLSILSNWIRVDTLVLLAYYSHMQSQLVYHHGTFGWWIFAGMLVVFFLLSHPIIVKGAAPRRAVPLDPPVPVYWLPVFASAGLAVLLATLLPLWSAFGVDSETNAGRQGLAIPTPLAQIQSNAWLPSYTGYDLRQAWTWEATGYSVELTALTYFEQHRGKKLIYFSNRIADPELMDDTQTIAITADFSVNRVAVDTDKGARLVWWFYLIDGHTATDAYAAKWLQFRAALQGQPRAALVAISVPCRLRGCAVELEQLEPENERQLLSAIPSRLQGLP